MKEAVAKALEAGWKPSGLAEESIWDWKYRLPVDQFRFSLKGWYASYSSAEIWSDPLFWKSLGKALKWERKCVQCGQYEGGHNYRHVFYPNGEKFWLEVWKLFIDHLAEEKDAKSFFNELLK